MHANAGLHAEEMATADFIASKGGSEVKQYKERQSLHQENIGMDSWANCLLLFISLCNVLLQEVVARCQPPLCLGLLPYEILPPGFHATNLPGVKLIRVLEICKQHTVQQKVRQSFRVRCVIPNTYQIQCLALSQGWKRIQYNMLQSAHTKGDVM